jgi:predicted nucleic acid-binding Zn finger protein
MGAALGGCVKEHVFVPSGRRITSVVGSNADEFVDPEKPFCSCESYFYGVLSGKSKLCYHLQSYNLAKELKLVREITFDDDEFDAFLTLLASDVMRSREIAKYDPRTKIYRAP